MIKLYFSIILSLFFLFLIIFVKKGHDTTLVKIKLFGVIEFSLPLQSAAVVRLLLIAGSVLSFAPVLFYDYMSLFPPILNMEVFFDEEGIKRTLAQYSAKELAPYNIPNDYESFKTKYYDDMDQELNRLIKMENFFTIQDGVVHSKGHVRFKIEPVQGWQHYHFKESEGELTQVLEIPNMRPIQFKSFFSKRSTGEDYFKLTLVDILIRHSKLICPVFKQILAENYRSEGVLFYDSVVGLIRAQVFPYLHVAPTIYLAKFEKVGHIPVAYAIYSF